MYKHAEEHILDRTSEIIQIKLLKTTRISDGVVRLEFVAGKAAEKIQKEKDELIDKISLLLNCSKEMIPGRCEELFMKWKKAKKTKQKEGLMPLESSIISEKNPIEEASRILQTQEEHLVKTIERFLE
jgi:alanyl-tRNA synthetase